jgi:hypothetical protein
VGIPWNRLLERRAFSFCCRIAWNSGSASKKIQRALRILREESVLRALRLILGEQVFQVRLRKTAREAFFAENIRDSLGFALLQLPDFLFDSSR